MNFRQLNAMPDAMPSTEKTRFSVSGFFSRLSCIVRKPDFCLCETNCEADQRLCFRHTDITISLLPKFQASSLLLWLYMSVCVISGRKPVDRFSSVAADLCISWSCVSPTLASGREFCSELHRFLTIELCRLDRPIRDVCY